MIDFLDINKNEISNLPNGVNISTMCASCKIGTFINVLNIEKYLPLHIDDILCVKFNKNKIRTLIPIPVKTRRNKKKYVVEKKANHFYNQITVIIRVNSGPIENWLLEPKINLKLFKNGSIQMSGCKSISNINIVLNKLLEKIKQVKGRFEDGKIIDILFVEELDKVGINNFKIDMINSNYNYFKYSNKPSMQIDRSKLFNLLIKKKIKSSFEPCIRACVIIKYTPVENNDEEKEISVFVFQKGNIIITGARTKNHIISACKYINNILLTHHDEINKKDDKEEEDLILKLHNDVLKENNIII
jgi:TATA-box binding protein (TBP) (component of TFIID and TFIIIB)